MKRYLLVYGGIGDILMMEQGLKSNSDLILLCCPASEKVIKLLNLKNEIQHFNYDLIEIIQNKNFCQAIFILLHLKVYIRSNLLIIPTFKNLRFLSFFMKLQYIPYSDKNLPRRIMLKKLLASR